MLHPPFRSTFDMTDIHIKTPPPPDIQQDNLLHLFHQEFLSGLPYGHKNNIRLLGCNIIKQGQLFIICSDLSIPVSGNHYTWIIFPEFGNYSHPGKTGDFTVIGLTSEEARQRIIANSHLLPHKIRLESNVPWLHIDVLSQYGIHSKVYIFGGWEDRGQKFWYTAIK